MKRSILPLLLLFALAGCSHNSPAPTVSKAAPPTPSLPPLARLPTVSPTVTSFPKPPGALAYWKAGSDYVQNLAFSPNGKRLATVDGGDTVQEWDAHSGKCLHSLQIAGSYIGTVAYSPDGLWLAATGAKDNTKENLYLWSEHSGKLIHTLTMSDASMSGIEFTTNHQLILEGDASVDLWDTKTWQRRRHFLTPTGSDRISVFASGGKRLVTDKQTGQTQIRSVFTGKILAKWREHHFDGIGYQSSVFSPDGRWLAAVVSSNRTDNPNIEIREADTGRLVRTLKRTQCGITFSLSGNTLAAYAWDYGVPHDGFTLWNIETGAHEAVDAAGELCAAFSPDGRRLATGDTEGNIIIVRVPSDMRVNSRRGRGGKH